MTWWMSFLSISVSPADYVEVRISHLFSFFVFVFFRVFSAFVFFLCVLFMFVLYVVWPLLPVSLNCLFVIAASCFSNIYLGNVYRCVQFLSHVIIIKGKVLLHQTYVTFAESTILFRSFWFSCLQRLLNYSAFKYFGSGLT